MKKKFWEKVEISFLLINLFIYIISTIVGGMFLIYSIFNVSKITSAIIWITYLISIFPILLFIDSRS